MAKRIKFPLKRRKLCLNSIIFQCWKFYAQFDFWTFYANWERMRRDIESIRIIRVNENDRIARITLMCDEKRNKVEKWNFPRLDQGLWNDQVDCSIDNQRRRSTRPSLFKIKQIITFPSAEKWDKRINGKNNWTEGDRCHWKGSYLFE